MQLEMVQRRAARFKPDYSYHSSVSQMLKDRDLSSLENKMDTLKELTNALVTPAGIIS